MWTLQGPLAQHSWAATSKMVNWRNWHFKLERHGSWRKQPSRWRKRTVHRCSPRLWMGTPRLGEIHHLCYEIAITSFSSSAICLGQDFRRWNITGTGSMFIKLLVLMVQVTHPHSFHSKFNFFCWILLGRWKHNNRWRRTRGVVTLDFLQTGQGVLPAKSG